MTQIVTDSIFVPVLPSDFSDPSSHLHYLQHYFAQHQNWTRSSVTGNLSNLISGPLKYSDTIRMMLSDFFNHLVGYVILIHSYCKSGSVQTIGILSFQLSLCTQLIAYYYLKVDHNATKLEFVSYFGFKYNVLQDLTRGNSQM